MLRLFSYLMVDILKVTDDFTGTTGAGWSGNWVTSASSGAYINIDLNRGKIGNNNVGNAASAYALTYTTMKDGEILFKVVGPATSRMFIYGFVSGINNFPDSASLDEWTFQNAVIVKSAGSSSPYLYSYKEGVESVQYPTMGALGTTAKWVRMRKEGTNVKIRVWADGASEPGTWNENRTVVDPDVAMSAFLGYDNRDATGTGSMFVDDFSLWEISSVVVNGGYTAEPMTSTSLANQPVFSSTRNAGYTAQAMTLTGAAVDPAIESNVRYATEDTDIDTEGGSNPDGTELQIDTNVPGRRHILIKIPFTSSRAIEHADLILNATLSSGGITASIGRATSDWVESTGTVPGVADETVLSIGGSGERIFDVTPIVQKWQQGTEPNYGFVISYVSGSSAQIRFSSSEVSTLALRPKLALTMDDGAVEVAVGPFTGVAEAPNALTRMDKTTVAAAGTASGLFVDAVATVESNPHVIISVEAAFGHLDAPGGFFSVPNLIPAPAMTGAGESVDVTVGTEKNAIVKAKVATASAVEPQALLDIDGVIINPGLANDPYFLEMLGTTDVDDFWYRLDEASGTEIKEARGNAAKDGDLFGSYSFGSYGPESRKAIKFTDGYFQRRGNVADDSDTTQFAFEVTIKTTDGNGILAYGLDRANPLVELGTIPSFRNSIFLRNGKVSTNWNYAGRTDSAYELSGVTNVADGNWHHIVVAFNSGPTNDLNSGLRIYIDGKLDIRRRQDVVPGLWASPDTYFGMPEAWRGVTPLYPWQKNFNGEVMEVAFRYEDLLSHDDVIELYYAVFGIVPVRATPATATGEMPQPIARGNKQRALVLYTKWNQQGLFDRIGNEGNSPLGYSPDAPDEFDHNINIGRVYEPGESPWEELAGYRVVGVPIMREDIAVLEGPYRDPVTDLPRLLNLQEDLDLDEYDIIVFRNWPDEGADRSVFFARGYTNDAIQDFLASVKQAVVDGHGLEVTNVGLAFDLGLITGAQAIPIMYDRGTDGLENDLRAAIVSPWFEDAIGEPFHDMHTNVWNRVVATVPHLTDIPNSEKIKEIYMTRNLTNGQDGMLPTTWGYKTELGAYQIGEVVLNPATFYNRLRVINDNPTTGDVMWDRKIWAITPNGLPSGTAVYKFSQTMYQGNTPVNNPYAEYIGAAILQPGDSWGGQRIAGKVFINFGENPMIADQMVALSRQIVPPNEEIDNIRHHETAEMREWDYTYTRVTYAATGDPFGRETLVKVPQPEGAEGQDSYLVTVFDKGVVGIDIIERYETEPVIVLSWALRGLLWLGVKEFVPAGSVTVRPTAAEGSATAPNPQTIAQRSVTVSVTPALGLGTLTAPDEAQEPDAIILVFPATGSGSMTGYGTTIEVAPLTGSGEMVDDFDLISASGEQIVVFLHAQREVELYLMEGIK